MNSIVDDGVLTTDELERALTSPDWKTRQMAVKGGGLSLEQLDRAMKDNMFDVRRVAEREVSLREALAYTKETLDMDCVIVDSSQDRSYTGKVLWINRSHVVQNLGRVVVAHLKTDLSRVVAEGEMIDVEYSNGKTVVSRQDSGVEVAR